MQLLTEKNQNSRESRDNCRKTSLLHDSIDDRDGHTSEHSWERPHSDVGNMSLRVVVSNVLELEVSVKADEPAGQTVEQLREWRVDVEVVLALDVMRRELAEVDFVEAEPRSCQCTR